MGICLFAMMVFTTFRAGNKHVDEVLTISVQCMLPRFFYYLEMRDEPSLPVHSELV